MPPPEEKPVPPDQLAAVERLIQVVDTLRSPGGCPWDAEQTVESLAPHLLEECHELADAVARGDDAGIREELGDLLMGVLMVARVASEDRGFGLTEVVEGITAKLIRRHPHVYGEVGVAGTGEVLGNWEAIKKTEKEEAGQEDTSALSGVPATLPALLRAWRVGQKAANAGFDWPDLLGPAEKVEEEWAEFQEAVARDDREAARHELGDLLFAVVNLARKIDVEPELALRGTIERFTARFRHIERHLGKPLGEASLEEMDALWEEAKQAEAAAPARPRP
ncbi:MAG: nucleoside triphosphate pyrophosphohydrolase [Planctomycetota bacterium]|nr:MAG: nucleoside triphosphate pyrophosphohydrolase [Planctomycetota bacterium]